MLIQLKFRTVMLPNKSEVMIVVRPFVNILVVDMNSLIITDVRTFPVVITCLRGKISDGAWSAIGQVWKYFPTGFYDES